MARSPEQHPGPAQHDPVVANHTSTPAAGASTPPPSRQAIKIRVVSWNLGDSVPKGDLSKLLGEVPPYHPPDHLITSLPCFDETDGDGHPYHLIVVAAQECPSASGVPRGLAAGVTKGVIGGLKEKEKLKERGKAREAKEAEKAEKAWVAQLERIHGTGTEDSSVAATPTQENSPESFTFPPKPPAKDNSHVPDRSRSTDTTAAASILSTVSADPSSAEANESRQETLRADDVVSKEASADGPSDPNVTPAGTLPSGNTVRTPHHGHHTVHITSGGKGWSDLLEDYLCRGIKHDPKARTRRSGSLSFRQGSISGSLPSTPLQGPVQNPFATGGLNSSPSSAPGRRVDTPSASMPVDRGQSPFSVSPGRVDVQPPAKGTALPQQPSNTLRQPIPIPAKGLVPPPSVLRGGNSLESRETAYPRAPPSPTFSFELQTPTPLLENAPLTSYEEAYRCEPSSSSYQPPSIDRHVTSSPFSYVSDLPSSCNPTELSTAGDTDSDIAPKPSDTRPRSLLAPAAISSDNRGEGNDNAIVKSRELETPAISQSPGYFTATPGQYKDKRLTPLQIPSSGSMGNAARSGSSGDSNKHSQANSEANGSTSKQSTGPYHFLVKERLLGLYLAIFVHRDCKDWVTGYDHDYVPAGLAGGRIGNKGGIGMSLNMAGHRFLFVNSHLAAHAHRVEARIANIAKIKSELHLDCFLPDSDPRAKAEDITDRYDTVFWMGDLNFRLDISRLHADWLVSRKEYAQALEFDQLRNAMIRGHVFDGFSEAPIDFAPTFKYDVWRSAKRTRSMKKKAQAKSREKDREARREGGECIMEVDEEGGTDNNLTDDQSSMIGGDRRASIDTSAALSTIAGTVSEEDVSPTSDKPMTVTQPLRPVAAVAKTTAIKAKHRFMKFIRSATPPVNIPSSSLSSRSSFSKSTSPTRSSLFSPPSSANWAAPDVTTHTYPAHLLENRRQSIDSTFGEGFAPGTSASYRPGLTRQISTKIKRRFATSQNNQDVNDDDSSSSSEEDIRKGVYDSSSKQRVPSWCDRVLWKTIIEQDKSETTPTSGGPLSAEGKITRMGHNLASKLHLRKDNHPHDVTVHDYAPRSAPIMSPVIKTQPPTIQQLVPTTVAVGAATSSSLAASLERQTRDSSRPSYARSNPGSSDSSPALSMKEADAFPRTRLPEKLKHRSISGAILRTPTSTTATSHEHGHRYSVGNMMSPDPGGEHAFLRSRTLADLHRTDTLHNLFSGDGVETSIANAKKWFSHLVRPRIEFEDAPAERSPSPEPVPVPEPPKRKGEVVCLKYDTLDDADMRRLEGRSDHRPIIFAAAVYI